MTRSTIRVITVSTPPSPTRSIRDRPDNGHHSIYFTFGEHGEELQIPPTSSQSALSDPFWLDPPDAPQARLVCATVRPASIAAILADFEAVDVAGCDADAGVALLRCGAEAIEYLSQLSPPDDPLRRDTGTTDWPLGDGGGELVTARDLLSGRLVGLPAELALRTAEAATPGIGSGCAAGQSLDDAISGGLWELLERDAVARWWYDGHPGRALPPEVERQASAYIAQLRGAAASRTTCLVDISTADGLPVVAALSSDRSGQGFVAGLAGHADAAVAACKAVRELVQMEVGLRLAAFKQGRGHQLNTHELRMLRREAELDCRSDRLCWDEPPRVHPAAGETSAAVTEAAIARLGQPVFAVDLTRDYFGLPVAKLVAPGLRTIPDAAAWEAADPRRVALY